ncbi:MAG: SPASM domain-containing protein [Clostridia bacterium]|nr:SPASM domain-containing protein [Clostridia bacterium]
MIRKAYLEITNVCNLSCTFCHKTARPPRTMTEAEFGALTDRLAGIRHLYFHLMGEPTLHPLLPPFIEIAKKKGFLPMLTTNGSLLSQKGELLLQNLPHKISISLHAPAANAAFADAAYLSTCIDFARRASEGGCIIALRLWNLGSTQEAANEPILRTLRAAFPGEWEPVRRGNGYVLAPKLFLEWGEQFDWPDLAAPALPEGAELFCHGLRDQIGVLSDGTVVPCCLDADGNLALGNLFESTLPEILASPRARAIYDGFTRRRGAEELCRRCGYARRFIRNEG